MATDEEFEEQRKNTEFAKLKAEEAKALAEIDEASEPKVPDTSKLKLSRDSGKIASDENLGHYAEVITYTGVDDVTRVFADEIVKVLKEEVGSNSASIMIVDSLDVAKLKPAHQQFSQGVKALVAEAKQIARDIDNFLGALQAGDGEALMELASGALLLAPALLTLVAEVVKFLQPEYTIKGHEFDVSHAAVASELAHALGSRAKSSSLELTVRMHEFNADIEIDAPTRAIYRDLQAEHVTLATKMKQIEDVADGGLNDSQKKVKKGITVRAKALITLMDNYAKAVTSPSSDGYSLYANSLRFDEYLLGNVTHLLFVKCVSAGGMSITEDRAFRSDVLYQIAGGAFTYVLARLDGSIIASRTKVSVSSTWKKLNSANLALVQTAILE